ncbi:MAG: 50S ribosomal protein L31e [Candidatus Bathyarchaeia archaeon]
MKEEKDVNGEEQEEKSEEFTEEAEKEKEEIEGAEAVTEEGEEVSKGEEKPLVEEEVVEEEAKPKREEKVEEEGIVEERIYTVPLGRAWIMPPNKRAARAIRILKDFLKKHMKLEARKEGEEEEEEPKKLIITNEVNEKIWSRGIEKPPRKIRVRAAKDKDGNVTVYLAEGD